ncbi:helicase-related protein [Anaerolineales bacterium HSG6]|nr:helicase-related protein [Anaerolineales bacterium HSG6]
MSNTQQKSGIRDNHHRGTVGQFLKAKIKDEAQLSIVSAYFTIYAYEALKTELDKIESLNFLFGEPRFIRTLDPTKTDKKAFKIEDEGLSLKNRLQQKRAARDCAEWIRDKVAIKSVRRANLLHGKMYYISNNGIEEAIMGSSNFTVSGLGLASAGHNNIELNLEVDSRRDRKDLKVWFDEIWHDDKLVEDVKADVLHYLAQLYQNHAPEFIYYKTLFHIFERFLDDQTKSGLLDERSQLVDTDIWNMLFEFQKDGVKGAINKILAHNGCIIADSVGLGKTFEALAIIKYFELLNYRVLVLCPKKLRENWTVYQAQNNSQLNPLLKDRFNYTVLSHTDLSRDSGYSGDINLETLHWGNYDLVVIDESHNFRNNTKGKRDEEGNIIRKSRYQRLMEDIIQKGIKTKVLLLSATPVNNNLKDLRNQIYFLTEGHDDSFRETLGIDSLKETLANAQRTFTEWSKKPQPRHRTDLLEKLSAAFFTLLDELTIARSRKHVKKYYADAVTKLGGFPKRLKPISIFPDIDLKDRFMSYDRLNSEISNYQLSLFNPSKYVRPQFRGIYEEKSNYNFRQSDRERFLIGMMKVNFLKRLESSVYSFAITMERTIDKIEALQARIKQFQQLVADGTIAHHFQSDRQLGDRQLNDKQLEFELEQLDIDMLDDEELQAAMQVGKKLKFNFAHLDIEAWLNDLRQDKEQLNLIYLSAKDVSPPRDAKLAELKQLITAKVQQPTINKQGKLNRKILVFTAFADTAQYLYNNLHQWATTDLKINLALVTGGTSRNKTSFGQNKFNHILTNFSPYSKNRDKISIMPQDGQIDLLIATDCISEGQNLQDCDYLINYDIHWNPVRIIQRFGRIDRIGSLNKSVQLVNFWPTPDLNKYINLKNRVEARMALVDIAATMEDDLLRPDDVEPAITDELDYRSQQLLRLKDEMLDMEDFNETVALTDFTLDDFRVELAKYIEANRQILQDAPLGLYTVVPTHSGFSQIAPGVIYCLKQKGNTSGNETVNPLQPYFLVYIRDDGVVRYTFAHPKQILEIYRILCAEKITPYEKLCNLFDRETKNGADMGIYNIVLYQAVDSIARTFRKRAIAKLQSGRGGQLIDRHQQANSASDFDLITWLVIK